MNIRTKQRAKALELMFHYYNTHSTKEKMIFKYKHAYFVNHNNKLKAFVIDRHSTYGCSNAYYIQCVHDAASEEIACNKKEAC